MLGKIMKTVFLVLLMIVIISCDHGKTEDPCYKIGATKEECEQNSECSYVDSKLIVKIQYPHFTYEWPCYMLLSNVSPAAQGTIGFCSVRNKSRSQDGYAGETFCYELSDNLFMTYYVNEWAIWPNKTEREKWVSCFDPPPEMLLDVTVPSCSSACGNGVIEWGEECDGENLGTPSGCAEFSGFTDHADYVDGAITCNEDCTRNYDACVSTGE